ncbi:MAG: thioredoxin family protein [Rhodoferax sp.]|nr:thioredoxin family protein [Rhodoferax sp.]
MTRIAVTYCRLVAGLLALLAVLWPAAAALAQGTGAVVTTEQVRAELLAHAPDGAQPGKPVWVGLQITHKPEWHTYWKNPGDSGLATVLQWTLPAGVTAGDIAWPLPRKIPIGTLANYGYEGTVLLPVPLTIDPSFQPGPLAGDLEVRLRASWLVCKQECIPQDGGFTLRIPVRSSLAAHGAAFDAALQAQPRALPASPGNRLTVGPRAIALRLDNLPAALQGKTLEFLPESPEVIDNAARWEQAWEGPVWTASIPLSAQRSNAPAMMPVVLAFNGQGHRAELPVQGTWPTMAPAPAGQLPLPPPVTMPAGPSLGLWAALAGALLGGLILNLMPCVFPVLAIKVLGFAQHGGDRRAARASGLAYTAGVVLSFVALGAVMLALRSAGERLGWGFQLQDPAVVALLAGLFTLIGLNLAGLFEFRQVLPSSIAAWQARQPVADAFLTGVLAVAVASPCTAPFMGASLGLAATLPAGEALAIFAVLGLGLALPYLLASLVPGFARALPRPGRWMETLRRFLAFPMFATVVWLVWVLGQQSGINGAGALLALLVALALLVWTFQLAGRTRAVGIGLAGLAFAALAWSLAPLVVRPDSAPAERLAAGWEAWQPGRVEQLTASGQTVFVDFTAAWCVTCQVNKKTTLGDTGLLAELAQRKVTLLRADWTRRDPAITEALARLGRNGVPVYVFYRAGQPPVVLSELLSVQDVRAALARL